MLEGLNSGQTVVERFIQGNGHRKYYVLTPASWIWTPNVGEVLFAGHPTLGTAHVIDTFIPATGSANGDLADHNYFNKNDVTYTVIQK